MVVRFLELLLRFLTDNVASEKILQFWLLPIMEEKLKSAYSKLDELLEVHKDHPMTTNKHFINSCKKPRQDNTKAEIEKRIRQSFPNPGQKFGIDDIMDILSTTKPSSHMDTDMIAAEEAFDNMNAFYEVSHIRCPVSTSTEN